MKATTALLVALVFGGALAWAAPEEAGFDDPPVMSMAENPLVSFGRALKGGKGSGGIPWTPLDCKCADSWTYKGCVYHGCSEIDSPGRPWCVVAPGCGSCDGYNKHTNPPNLQWKYCKPPQPAVPNCNCKAKWTYKNCDYKGCSDVDSPGKPWCIVEDSCDKYDGYSKGQKWKYCPKPVTPPPKCTCLPVWWYKGCEYKGCSDVDSPGKPWCVVNSDCPHPDGVSGHTHPANQKWKYCPAPSKPPPTCKCEEYFWYKGCKYSGCIKVDSPWGKPWCVVNDDCPHPDGVEKKTTPPNKKWKYCKY